MSTILEAAKEETYMDVHLLLCDIVHKFQSKHGGDYEELKSEANYLFLLAYDSYKDAKSQFSTWVYFRVWKGLLDYWKKEIKLRKNVIFGEITDSPKNNSSFQTHNTIYTKTEKTTGGEASHFLFHLKNSVSMESCDIINLLVDMPSDLFIMINENRINKTNIKRCLRKHLRDYGWTVSQITECFIEIRKALR